MGISGNQTLGVPLKMRGEGGRDGEERERKRETDRKEKKEKGKRSVSDGAGNECGEWGWSA